jgi:uncharacterized protein YehS (DUF1456 family)
MLNNDILRSIRFMMNAPESQMIEIFKLDGLVVTPEEMTTYLKKEDDAGFEECSHRILGHFLNGLVYFKRGKDESRPKMYVPLPVTNNTVLKKLRVAFELKDDDIISILREAEFDVSKSEVGALFRKEDHPHFRQCGDQFLRNFLKGLTNRLRKFPPSSNT